MASLESGLGGLKRMFTQSKYHQLQQLHSKVVIKVNSNVYILVSMSLNTTHVRGKGGYNG